MENNTKKDSNYLPPQVTSIHNAEHYTWGDNCDGWFLLKTKTLTVIQEKIPFGKTEQLHFHAHSQQVFFILSGTATFEIQGQTIIANALESVHILPNTKHCIANNHKEDLCFLVISQPNSHGDRHNINEEKS